MNLFQINKEIENFEFKIDELTGEVLNLDELDEIKMSKNEKIENIALFIKNLKSDEEAIDKEIKSLTERKKSKSNQISNLTTYLEIALAGEKYESPKCKISYRQSSSVIVEDGFIDYAIQNNLEALYKREEKFTPIKKEIKAFINKTGEELPFVQLVRNKNINIK